MRGSFVEQEAPTQVFVGYCPGDRYLQFQGGPRWAMELADYMGESYVCVDEETKLDHVVLRAGCIGVGCVPRYGVYRVNAETKAIEPVFSIRFKDYEWLHRPLVTTGGECLWRGVSKGMAVLDAALAPVLVGRGEGTVRGIWGPGEAVVLRTRPVPTEAVANALGGLPPTGFQGAQRLGPLPSRPR